VHKRTMSRTSGFTSCGAGRLAVGNARQHTNVPACASTDCGAAVQVGSEWDNGRSLLRLFWILLVPTGACGLARDVAPPLRTERRGAGMSAFTAADSPKRRRMLPRAAGGVGLSQYLDEHRGRMTPRTVGVGARLFDQILRPLANHARAPDGDSARGGRLRAMGHA
jgi:hypothetical protein